MAHILQSGCCPQTTMKSQYMDQVANGASRQASPPPPLMGKIMDRDIVERTVFGPLKPPGGPTKMKLSVFAKTRQHQPQGQAHASPLLSPSLNVPLGSFVKSKQKVTSCTRHPQQQATLVQEMQNATTPVTISAKVHSTPLSISRAAEQDANNMWQQMSDSERFERAKEVQMTLSPQAIAVLKKRITAKEAKSVKPAIATMTTTACATTATCNKRQQANNPQHHVTASTKSPSQDIPSSTEEKQRLADLLSKVKTEDELLAVYEAETGSFSPITSELDSDYVALTASANPFPLACVLLRSTVPRQNLWAAKVVAQGLQEQWERGDLCSIIATNAPGDIHYSSKLFSAPDWPYPDLLPASLRCLLDASEYHQGYLLHSFVLQAIYNLLRLRSCIEHVVDVDINSTCNINQSQMQVNATSIYQEWFLEDAVPIPPVGTTYQSISNPEVVTFKDSDIGGTGATTNARPVSYKTCSSSESAKIDGQAFAKDPSWTLLTRMCIIPRLAHLLKAIMRTANSNSRDSLPPREALSAICGILAIISQRSLGAATAIMKHPTLMQDLIELTIKRQHLVSLAFSAIRLLCTLARQSHMIAEMIPFADAVSPLLATQATSQQEHQLQKWSVILWRTLLRYGLGLSEIPTMITHSAPHMVVAPAGIPYSLTTEFFSAFANVLLYHQATRGHVVDGAGVDQERVESFLDADHWWLSSSAQQAVANFETCCRDEKIQPQLLKFCVGQLQFLSAFLQATKEKARFGTLSAEEKQEVAETIFADNLIQSCEQVLDILVNEGILGQAICEIRSTAFLFSFAQLPGLDKEDGRGQNLIHEASSCAFLCSFVSLQLSLLDLVVTRVHDTNKVKRIIEKSVKRFLAEFTIVLTTCSDVSSSFCRDGLLTSTARRGWLNRASFASIQFLIAAKDYLSTSMENRGLRSLQFSLLGRLERGDEAMAAVLFSQAPSLDACGTPTGEFSEVFSVFLKELCLSSSARIQLEHSFHLLRGQGLTEKEFSAFKLQTLHSDVDSVCKSQNQDQLLPMGTLWLFLVISSAISEEQEEGTIQQMVRQSEGAKVLSSCLKLLLELEQSTDGCTYAALVSTGAKAYHLLTVCLHPEHILQNEHVIGPAELLLDLYIGNTGDSFALEFARACLLHSIRKREKAAKAEHTNDKPTQDIFSKVLNDREAGHGSSLDDDETEALLQFLRELCDAYLHYGARYDFFTKCVRLFLHSVFPPRIKCEAMRHLGGVLSRLSLPGENDPYSETCRERLIEMLERSVSRSSQGDALSARESPEFLDAVASVYSKGGAPLILFGFNLLFSVMVHARHLGCCLQAESFGLEAENKRLYSTNDEFASLVNDATRRFLGSNEKSHAKLVHATVDAAVTWASKSDATQKVGPLS